jgi:hypothetical protein
MMKDKESIIEKFGLPKWLEGKSFAEAAKIITKKTRGENNELNSADDIATEKSLMDKLQAAQEYVKKINNPESQSIQNQTEQMEQQSPMTSIPEEQSESSNQYFLGGLLGGAGGAAGAAAGIGGAAGSIAPGMGAIQAGTDLLGKVAGGTAETGDYVNAGVKAGLSFIPGGNMLNPLVDIGTSFIGKGERDKEAADEKANLALADRKGRINSYNYGGDTDPIKNPPVYNPNEEDDYYAQQDKNKFGFLNTHPYDSVSAQKTESNRENSNSTARNLVESIGELKPQGLNDSGNSTDPQSAANSFLKNYKNLNTDTEEDIARKMESENKKGFNPGKLLRYAPAAMNAAQLAGLDKPKQENYERANSTYNRNYVDEKSLQNTVKGDVNNMRNALSNASGGSGSTNRANLLASQLKGTQALSDSYLKADMMNRREDDKFQKRNAENERINLNQSNMETVANAANQGAYETQKSKLLSSIGNDLGGVGREELFKEYPELMGLDYKAFGDHIEGEKLRKEKSKEAKKILAKYKKKKS